jgi:hypothetical protein
MSPEAGAGVTRSRGPACGDATVEPAKARRCRPYAHLRGQIPEGTLFRPATRPCFYGDATKASAFSPRPGPVSIPMTEKTGAV